jgi:hypothetical protein
MLELVEKTKLLATHQGYHLGLQHWALLASQQC